MTGEDVLRALDACAAELRDTGLGKLEPVRCETREHSANIMFGTKANHLLYMVDTAKNFVKIGKMDKAMRWLGFIQGVLWGTGHCSIDDLSRMNEPNEERL